jgi:hypothetical protein
MRVGINGSLKYNGSKSGRKWEDLVGYSLDKLKKHLRHRFQPGMTWYNYGTMWQIDHINPVSLFNFRTPEELDFKRCWSLKNLRPLFKKDNLAKSNKLVQHFQQRLPIDDL